MMASPSSADDGIRNVDAHVLVPRMLVEITADQLAIFGPLVKRVGCRVNADKAPARMHIFGEGFFWRRSSVVHSGQEHYGAEATHIIRGEDRDILAFRHLEAQRHHADCLSPRRKPKSPRGGRRRQREIRMRSGRP